jgi:ABC-2 type transport system permease protein
VKKTLTILRHEFKQTLKRKAFIIMTVALPLVLILGYGIYQAVQHWYEPGEPQEVKIGYVDETGMFDEYTTQQDIIFILYPGEEKARDALLAGEIEEYFIIPADYISSGYIVRYTTKSEFEVPDSTWKSMGDFLLSNLLAGEVAPELLERAKVPMQLTTVELDESGEIVSSQDVANKIIMPIVFGMIFVFAIFFSSGFLLQSVSEEKENRVIEIILSSVSPRQLLAGKVLGLGTAGLLQIAIWFISIRIFADAASVNIPALSNLSVPASLLTWGILFFILGYILFAAMFAGLGSLGSTARESQSISGILVLPAILPIWLNYFIVNNPESTVAKTLTFIPITAPVTAMMRLSRDEVPAWEIALSLVILVASVVLAMWVAAKVFRIFILMYGKTPALREIVRYIRQS